MRRKAPCSADCERRTITCHSFCKEYKEWKAEIEETNALRQKEMDKYNDPYRPRKYKNMILGIKKSR